MFIATGLGEVHLKYFAMFWKYFVWSYLKAGATEWVKTAVVTAVIKAVVTMALTLVVTAIITAGSCYNGCYGSNNNGCYGGCYGSCFGGWCSVCLWVGDWRHCSSRNTFLIWTPCKTKGLKSKIVEAAKLPNFSRQISNL